MIFWCFFGEWWHDGWMDRNWYFLYGNSFAYMEKWVVTHFRKNNVKLTSIFYKKNILTLQYSQNQSSTIVNIIHFCVYIMLLIDRLTGVILFKIESIFWYFAVQSLHSHTIFQLHSTPPNYSSHPNNPLIPTIFPFSAILLPYLYSKLPSPLFNSIQPPIFHQSIHLYAHHATHLLYTRLIYSTSQSTKTLQTP